MERYVIFVICIIIMTYKNIKCIFINIISIINIYYIYLLYLLYLYLLYLFIWETGRLNRSETNMRFHQPRSAPSSPTIDRKPIGFTSPPKSPNGISVAINCRKDLRLRNNNFTDTRYILYI